MSGMLTATTPNLSDYNNRTVIIEVRGALGELVRNSNYTLKVPYNRMSEKIQQISRMGGKIANISLASSAGSTESE